MFEVLSVKEAQEKVISSIETYPHKKLTENLSFSNALGRVLAEDIQSPMNLPPFSRSTVDGYAVKASDTFGVSESLPSMFQVKSTIAMGEDAQDILQAGEAIQIATGGMLPEGADAVVMLEDVEYFDDSTIAVTQSVAPGENVIWRGEDIAKGDPVLSQGHEVRAQDAGALAALGILELEVFKRPVVSIISNGDELVSPEQELGPGKIRDVNSWALKASVEKHGCKALLYGIIPDERTELEQVITEAKEKSDVIIMSGGSSVGERDMTSDVIDDMGEPGLIFHGVAVKPGKPTILGMLDDTPIFGLSGNPVSALVTYNLFVKLALDLMSGTDASLNFQTVSARLGKNVSSKGGREDYIRVRLRENENGELQADPILGESGLIFTMVEASGMICVPRNTEGLPVGELVEVIKY